MGIKSPMSDGNRKNRYHSFLMGKKDSEGSCSGSGSTSITSFFSPVTKYKPTDTKQQAIRSAITDLIVESALPIQLVEQPAFRKLITICDAKYIHGDRKTAVKAIDHLYEKKKRMLMSILKTKSYLSLTLDIWTDRKMRSYLGITAHYLNNNELRSSLLSCLRMKGAHTGQNIRDEIESILTEYGIISQIKYIITDNASNMKKAIELALPGTEAENDSENEDDYWPDTDVDTTNLSNLCASHLRCFAHSLQLVIKDGFKQITEDLKSVINRCLKITSLLHSSTKFKELFEKEFGNISIPQPCSTRWNSTYTHLKRVLDLNQSSLSKILDGWANLKILPREYKLLKEFVSILHPFYEVTEKTQGEKIVTISYVLPSVLMLLKTLKTKKLSVQFLNGFIVEAINSIERRFRGLLLLVDPELMSDSMAPFGDSIYLLSAVLDPNWGMNFLDFTLKPEEAAAVKAEVKDMISLEIMGFEADVDIDETQIPESQSQSQPEDDSLFASFFNMRSCTSSEERGLASNQEVAKLMTLQSVKCNPIKYWSEEKILTNIKILALRVLAVPATSAPVERVFSSTGFIMRPRRSSMAATTLSKLVFLKINKSF